MKLDETKRVKGMRARFLLVVFCMVFVLLIAVLDRAEIPPEPQCSSIEIEKGWIYRDTEGNCRKITVLNGKLNTPAGETIRLENKLPQTVHSGMFLCFRSSQQSVRVLVDEKQIYEYDTSDLRLFSRATPSAWNFVPISQESAGKTVAIETVSPYKQSSGQLNRVFFGPYSEVELYIINSQLPQFIISLFIMIMAVFFFFLSLWLKKTKDIGNILDSLCLFILLVGIWVFSESKMPPVFSGLSMMEPSITFFVLFLMPMPYADYMSCRLHPRHQKALSLLFYAAFTNTVVCTLIQICGAADMIELLPAAHVMLILTAGYTLTALVYDRYTAGGNGDILEFTGLMILFLCGVVELGFFYRNDLEDTGTLVPLGILVYLILISGSAVRNLLRRTARTEELSRELQDSRVKLMVGQIQPHFIYNTLGAIQAYIMKSPNTAYKMVQDFSDYLRANIQSITRTDPILFSEELKHIRAYTDIELVRFRNRIQVVYEIGPKDFLILPLTVQPLVENAIKHGLCKQPEGGILWIRTLEEEKNYLVIVEDNGIGFDVSEIMGEKDNFGLMNIQKRLKSQMGAEVKIESAPGKGTRVTVTIPRDFLGGGGYIYKNNTCR